MWEEIKALPLRTKILSGVLLVLLTYAVYVWNSDNAAVARKDFVAAPESSHVTGVPKVDVPVSTVKSYRKDALAKKVKLPEAVEEDPKKVVLAVADTSPTKSGMEVMAVLDTATGETKQYVKEKPLPFLQFINEKRIGIAVGAGTKNNANTPYVGKVFAEWTVVRVGGVYGGVQAEVNTNSEAKAFVALDYRF